MRLLGGTVSGLFVKDRDSMILHLQTGLFLSSLNPTSCIPHCHNMFNKMVFYLLRACGDMKQLPNWFQQHEKSRLGDRQSHLGSCLRLYEYRILHRHVNMHGTFNIAAAGVYSAKYHHRNILRRAIKL
jgi:hypothetical protein